MYKLNVNRKIREVDAEPEMPLLWVLREVLGMTGTKYGSGIAQCGACTVYLDGEPARSCSIPGSAVTRRNITTIEQGNQGQPRGNQGHPLAVLRLAFCLLSR